MSRKSEPGTPSLESCCQVLFSLLLDRCHLIRTRLPCIASNSGYLGPEVYPPMGNCALSIVGCCTTFSGLYVHEVGSCSSVLRALLMRPASALMNRSTHPITFRIPMLMVKPSKRDATPPTPKNTNHNPICFFKVPPCVTVFAKRSTQLSPY